MSDCLVGKPYKCEVTGCNNNTTLSDDKLTWMCNCLKCNPDQLHIRCHKEVITCPKHTLSKKDIWQLILLLFVFLFIAISIVASLGTGLYVMLR
ncbi:MAG: hypothetical protein Edafosvirus5_56 [Edafosvirus sp.]|uniref:Uncharacterized protein n=1 Tax=Edafosvirus sp. TaxID=2487765 RepID=A0A3G4ZTC3_9VIRU|nr:MAG: hypothetical protein Edafosvirus5_56 [Edafosvirus sp.]